MTRVEPSGADLLDEARERLLEELLPQLPPAQHYLARMVANAMAIAGRELRLEAPAAADDAHGQARLAAEIRSGRYDDPAAAAALLPRLRQATRERLAISNPRVLAPRKAP